MMKFRQYHLSAVLKSLELQEIPLDALLSHYFRTNKALGSKDRHYIGEIVYNYTRWKNLFQHLNLEPSDGDPTLQTDTATLPPHIRHGMPEHLYNLLAAEYGEEKTNEICLISNTRAPLTLRVNLRKTTREHLLNLWAPLYKVSPCPSSPCGIHFHERINFFILPEFREGLFEIQDEASQLAAELVKARPKQHVLDFCAGAGGKTLAIAPLLNNSGQIYLNDIRPLALQEARRRLNRAGIQNAQFVISPAQKGKIDWVVVDVPCTGTGTLRRNPDLKWKFDPEKLDHLIEEQQAIFREALTYLHPNGHIVYMTCSLLPQENEQQVEYFQRELGLEVVETFKTVPLLNGMDGFFAVSLKKKTPL